VSRVAVVVGGASGLGEAISEKLSDDGFFVVVADMDVDGAALVAGRISGVAVEVDVRDDAAVAAMVDRAAAFGPLRTLVLSAAVETRAPLLETTDEAWREVIDTNLKGPFLCLRHAVPRMVEAGGGSVIALGSTLGMIVAPRYPANSASKFALTNLCKQVAIEHASDGIRVNVVAPSATEVGLFARVAEATDDPEGIKAFVAGNVPMGRLGTADDVTALVAFLASDQSSYLSGAVIPLDGGMAARRL
jgi:NAD(P)-dependent dehydrogenase (short-subunit alcohol dehydrogenase family)